MGSRRTRTSEDADAQDRRNRGIRHIRKDQKRGLREIAAWFEQEVQNGTDADLKEFARLGLAEDRGPLQCAKKTAAVAGGRSPRNEAEVMSSAQWTDAGRRTQK